MCRHFFCQRANRFLLLLSFTDILGGRVILSDLYSECDTWRWISLWEWEIVVTATHDSWLIEAEKQPRWCFPFKDDPSPSKQRSPHMSICHLSVWVHALLLRGVSGPIPSCGSAFARRFKAYVSSRLVLKGNEGFQSFQELFFIFSYYF